MWVGPERELSALGFEPRTNPEGIPLELLKRQLLYRPQRGAFGSELFASKINV